MDVSVQQIIAGFLFIGVRLSGLMLFAPFFSSDVLAPRLKVGVVFALSILLYPIVAPHFPAVQVNQWPLIVIGELVTGSAIGIATQLVFDAVQMAGQTLSVQMGYSLVTILDPTTQADSTVVATFHQMLVLLIFLSMNVHFWLLRAIGESFAYLPPGSAHLHAAFVTTLVSATGSVFFIGVQLAAPVLCATLLADIVLGLLGKASPQLPVMLLGPAIKSVMGLLLLAGTLRFWPDLFRNLFLKSQALAIQLLHLAR